VKIDGETATRIDVAGHDLVLLGYNITTDKDYESHFIV
jgi:hypothetical protein